ncbi:hypothetical protein LZ24_01635 [Desulfobotulus alkaliphilus]|uniref:Uncharacterized protein n=1 Tax=Desulfobotulus alkaliphilus TaxID=622671 RepID=A0A562RT36_9BACT|nr:hypothetical protein [Desulfobotulus alkaliphilus]TWI72229.1 hypothetical protein LZ24_01635 [Desulfobotulus alkaliphilus]
MKKMNHGRHRKHGMEMVFGHEKHEKVWEGVENGIEHEILDLIGNI